jgi:RecA-family ATPase
MAARVSTGAPWPDTPLELQPVGGVVLLSAEDDPADTIRPRLDAHGADVTRIVLLQSIDRPDGTNRAVDLAVDGPALEAAIDTVPNCRLVVVDPISAYLGGVDSHSNSDVRGMLAQLAELAARRRVAVVAVTHLRKGDGPAMYRAMGSLAFVAAARAAWAIV